jgi:hypothetical protein
VAVQAAEWRRWDFDERHRHGLASGDGSGVGLEIACQAPETAEPAKGAFDNPALGYDPTAVGERSTISIVP